MGISSGLPVIASSLGGIRQLDEVGLLGAQSGVLSSSAFLFPPPSSFSHCFASSAPYSHLSFPTSSPPPFSAPLASLSSAFPPTFASLPRPFITFTPPFPSLSSLVRPVCSLAPSLASPVSPVRSLGHSVPAFSPSVSSPASPVVTVTTAFPSLDSSSSCLLVFSSASPVVSSGSVGSSSWSPRPLLLFLLILLLCDSKSVLFLIQKRGKIINFCWVPAHVGITGNERADRLAKEAAVNSIPRAYLIPSSDFIPTIKKKKIRELWQFCWDLELNNKMREITTSAHLWLYARMPRKLEVILCHFRTGHSRLTHGYLRFGEYQPFCLRIV